MKLPRLTTALLVAELVFTGLLLVGTVSRAISLNDLGIRRPASVDVQVISEEQGINGSKYSECRGNLLNLFNGQLAQQVKNWAQDTINDLLQMTKNIAVGNAMCKLNGLIKQIPLVGKALAIECVQVPISDAKAELKTEFKARLKSNFLVNCTTTVMQNIVTETATTMLQTQGLDGGIAAATDWSRFLNVRPAELAQRQWWALLANTDICPAFRDKVLNDLGVPKSYRDSPPNITIAGFRTDERAPFELRAKCTLPESFDVTSTDPDQEGKNSGYMFLALMEQPQNNWRDFEAMALAEFETLKSTRVAEAYTEALAGGGFSGTRGECSKDPDGKCIDDGVMKQVPGAVRDIIKSDLEGYYSRMTVAIGDGGLMDDIAARIQTRILDLSNAPLPFKLELGPERDPANFTPEPTPTPAPGETSPNDPACTGGDARCTCVKDDPTARAVASGVISQVIASVMQNQPALFESGTSKIAPGVDFRLVLQAICDIIGAGVCHLHPAQDDEIVLGDSGISTSFDVITGDGFVRTDGGSPVAACTEGVQ